MLIIGHRGAAGLADENTLEALRAGLEAGADMVEFDVRLTSDNIPVLIHDPFIGGKQVNKQTYFQLKRRHNIVALQDVLDEFFGRVLLNIELKEAASAEVVYKAAALYVTKPDDWDNILFSSFKSQALHTLHEQEPRLRLALLQHINPYVFIRLHRQLKLSAVGFHRLRTSRLALAIAKRLGIFTYVYTIDTAKAARSFQGRGIDGVVTNYPNTIASALKNKR